MAIKKELWDICKILIDAGAKTYYNGSYIEKDLSPIFKVCDMENTEILDLMCGKESVFYSINSRGETPLTYASRWRKFKTLNYLSLR